LLHPYVVLLARLVLGSIWIAAALAKLWAGPPLGNAVVDFHLLPRRAAAIVGMVLPLIELLLGVLLILGQWTTTTAEVSVSMLLLFTCAIVISLVRGNRVNCNCFGQWGEKPISVRSVARNLGLVAIGSVVVWRHSDYLSADGWWNGSALLPSDPPPADFVPVILMVVATGLLWVIGSSAYHAMKNARQHPPVSQASD
jgi:uncharacterized membrane protein YphA (DoxX/SURF4 family)